MKSGLEEELVLRAAFSSVSWGQSRMGFTLVITQRPQVCPLFALRHVSWLALQADARSHRPGGTLLP